MQTDLAVNAPMFFMRGGDGNYMMRSERRSGHGNGMPPKKKRRKPSRHPVYALITILALILAFPIGLILLWLPRLRWSKTVKLVLTIVTGVLFFLLMAFALNFKTGDERLAGLQNQVKSRLDYVMDTVRETTTNTEKMKDNLFYYTPRALNAGLGAMLNGCADFVTTVRTNTLAVVSNAGQITGSALDWTADAVNWVGTGVRGVLHIAPSNTDAATPEITAEPTLSPADDTSVVIIGGKDGPTNVFATGTDQPEDSADLEPTPDEVRNADSTAAPTDEPPKADDNEPAPVETDAPETDAQGKSPLIKTDENTPDADSTPEITLSAAPVQTPEPTAQPTVEMTAQPTAEPTPEITPEPTAEPTPEVTSRPTAVEPASAETPEPEAAQPSPDVTPTYTAEPEIELTPTPVSAATPKTAPASLPAIKPYGETTVYYFGGSKWYHRSEDCGSMHDAPAHTLIEARDDGKPACRGCNPPSMDLLGEDMVVWCGEDGTFHITDDCAMLTKNWTAMKFDEAWLEEGMNGCPLCGSSSYIEYRTQNPVTTPVPPPPVIEQP